MRKIIHIDQDAFYASVEQREQPRLRGKPVAVGYDGKRGVVMTASYEARVFGVHSAMPIGQARALCPELIVVPGRMALYREVSAQIRALLRGYSDLVEPLSLDEAYLDVSEPKQGPPSATVMARLIKRDIAASTGLTATAGVSCNKFLAKLASSMNKPNGLTVILPEEAAALVASLPVSAFHGVGPKTALRMAQLRIHTGAELRQQSAADLTAWFGKLGAHFYAIARGIDERPVEADRTRKSLSAETTFAADSAELSVLLAALEPLCHTVAARLAEAALQGRVVVLKVKFADFDTLTRRATLPVAVTRAAKVLEVAAYLLNQVQLDRPVRLLGVGVHALVAVGTSVMQPLLFAR